MKPKVLAFAAAIITVALFACESQAQSPPCGAPSFYLYGNYQNQEVLIHFFGINGSAYSGNPQAYLYTALNFTNTAYIDAAVIQVVAINGVPQDGPGTYLAPNSAEFQAVLNEALIWAAIDYWYFQFGGQSEMNTEQNDFQQVYRSEWQQEAGITLATLVNYASIIGAIEDDWPSGDSQGAEQVGQFVEAIADTIQGYTSLQNAFGGSAPNILNVLQQYGVISGQNYTSAQLIVGMSNLNPNQLPQFESDLYAAAYPGKTLESSTQQYLTSFLENLGSGAISLGSGAAASALDMLYLSRGVSGLTSSDYATIAVGQANDFIADGLPALALDSAANTIIQSYIEPQAAILQDMVAVQNILAPSLFPELTSVSGEMANNGLGNFDVGRSLAADIETISSFEAIWCNLGVKEESNQIVQSQLQQYLTLGPAFGGRAANMYNMLTTASSISQGITNQATGIPAPAVTGLSETIGVFGDQITITGSGFCNAQAVYFGNVLAPLILQISITPTKIVAMVPNGTGTVDVRVVGPGGVSQANANDQFSYKTISPPPTTKIITLSGDLTFGNVAVATTAHTTLMIANTGNSTLTVSSISYPNGFTGSWSGTIPAGGSTTVTVTFSPTSATSYGGNITVNSDATSGSNTIGMSGQGINVTSLTYGPLLIASVGSTFVNINVWIYPNGSPRTAINEYVGGSRYITYYTPAGQTSPFFSQPNVSGLQPATQYSLYLETGGGLMSQVITFETLPAGSQPTIQEEDAGSVTTNGATFNAIIVPDSQLTTASFSYTIGSSVYTSPSYSIPANSSQQGIGPWTVTNLPPATTIYWQVTASNLWGLTSVTQNVETLPLPPSILSLAITNVTLSSVSLVALLNPNGGDADFALLVTNLSNGSVTNTAFTDIGSGNSPESFSPQLNGLEPGTNYAASLVVTNLGGVSSLPFQFTTLPITPPTLTIAPSNGVAIFSIGNAAAETYVVETSTNLVTWQPWQTNSGLGSFTINTSGGSSLFYRARLLVQ